MKTTAFTIALGAVLALGGCFDSESPVAEQPEAPEKDFVPEGHSDEKGVPQGAAQAEPPDSADIAPGDVERPPAGEVQYPEKKADEIANADEDG